jgi:uncharacterized membrane protein
MMIMDDVTIARALHVLAIVHWIGGLTMVTAVILPAIRRYPDRTRRAALFEAVEGRFAWQARISVTVAGLTGFYMAYRLDAWDRFLDPGYWWMHAMVLLWAFFTIMLFIAEPLFLHARFSQQAARDPDRALAAVQRAHNVLWTLAAITVGAAVLGAHGMLY